MFNFHPYPHQQALIESKSRQSFIVGPRATGKTMGLLSVMASRLRRGYGSSYRAALVSTNPHHLQFLVGQATEAFEWVKYSFRRDPFPMFVFPDGGTFIGKVVETGNELCGLELNIVAFDHLTRFTREQYKQIVDRLRDLPTAPARIVASVEKERLFEPLPDWIEYELAQPANSIYLTSVVSERPKRRASEYLNPILGVERPV